MVAPLATGIRISEIAVYQGLKTTLMKDGAAVTDSSVPIVEGKDSLVRVFLKLDTDWSAREVVVRFVPEGGAALENRVTPTSDSTEAALTSTVNFDLKGDQLTPGFSYTVEIREAAPDVKGAGTSDGARWPVEGASPMGAQDTGEALLVTIIPVKYTADGSGRLPDMSDAAIERLRSMMYNLYPTRKVEFTIAPEMAWSTAVQPSGSGWSSLLNAIARKRQQDAVPVNVYYYGLFAPADSIVSYCGGGCVAGLSSLSRSVTDAWARASIGLGFGGKAGGLDAAGTFVHEVGHAHGRNHAPCGLGGQQADSKYPYMNATIGVWGYDLVTKKLIDPAGKNRDMMSYCEPMWISDYTYKALFTRVQGVNAAAYVIPPPDQPAAWRSYIVDGDGRVSGGDLVIPNGIISGETRAVERIGHDGSLLRGSRTGQFYPFDHLPGGFLLVPDDGESPATIRLK
jgi:hypothetical protein